MSPFFTVYRLYELEEDEGFLVEEELPLDVDRTGAGAGSDGGEKA